MSSETVVVPDLGGAEEVEVIEVSVAVGDTVEVDQTLLVLESDKAMMEIPAPATGKVLKIYVKEGDQIKKEGDPLVDIEADTAAEAGAEKEKPSKAEEGGQATAESAVVQGEDDTDHDVADSGETEEAREKPEEEQVRAGGTETEALKKPLDKTLPQDDSGRKREARDSADKSVSDSGVDLVYAGPAVRRLAREMGVDLAQVKGSGPHDRILKEDVQAHVKTRMTGQPSTGAPGIPGVPVVDFSQFGPVEQVKMSRIDKATASNMHRSWLNVPHVTHFDDADITDLEIFRKSLAAEGEKRGAKMTPVPFILKACAVALANNPVLNRSLHDDGEHFVQKQYFHIGMAVDTPRGLLVPVVRDVDKKTLWDLAAEVAELAAKARDGKLTADEMQGGCFTVSSLGAIGGNGFTPIINTPQVAILGVSRAQLKPVWNEKEFVPRTLLPLSLSYDHRVVNGGDAGRFMTDLVAMLGDIRRALL